MADEFDEELDRGPEGSIITPIFLGCSAMGLGCVFSLGAIIIGVMIFLPGVWSLVNQFSSNPMREPAIALAEANPQVMAALGTPLEAELDDIDETSGTDGINIEVGDAIEISATYVITGPVGSGRMHVVGSRLLEADSEWNLSSVLVTLAGGEQIRVYPGESDVPPPPAQLAPPAILSPPEESGAQDGETGEDQTQDDALEGQPPDN